MKENKENKKSKKSSKAQERAMEVAESFVDRDSIKSDPNGSWTGKTAQKGEKPTQDVDDL
ncbi:MAG: hypothetical protein Q4C12_07015 [Clostridia bacterium]|nr:hypothetical protein [Clostridia bacterium]